MITKTWKFIQFWGQVGDANENTVYAATLFIALLLSPMIPWISAGHKRAWFSTTVGIFNVILFCRDQVLYILIILFLSLITLVCKRPVLEHYFYPFLVLGVARLIGFLNIVPLYPLTNSILLLLVLRVIDFTLFASSELPCISLSSAAILLMHYVFFFPGLWSGPLLHPHNVFGSLTSNSSVTSLTLHTNAGARFSTTIHRQQFDDNYSNGSGSQSTVSSPSTSTPFLLLKTNNSYAITRIKESTLHIVAYFVCELVFSCFGRFYGLESLNIPKITQLPIPILIKLFLVWLSLVLFRARFVIAWLLAETSVLYSGIGSNNSVSLKYAQSMLSFEDNSKDTNYKKTVAAAAAASKLQQHRSVVSQNHHLEETVSPFLIFKQYSSSHIEFGYSLTQVIRHWNQCVQSWFVRRVYRVYRPPSALQRRFAVFVMSAFWHGLSPGYYLGFLGFPVLQMVQTSFLVGLEAFVSSFSFPIAANKSRVVTRSCGIVTTQLLLTFAAIPFVVKTAAFSWATWKSLYFYGLWLSLMLFVFDKLFLRKYAEHSRKMKKN